MAASADLDLLIRAAREAGDLALGYFRNDPKAWAKGETSIVSEADIAVDRLLAERLLAGRPDYGWLSEETADDPARLSRPRVFVVDPIDGTRAFLAGEKEWTVALAVVEHGETVTSVLYAPALGQMFQAEKGLGALRNGSSLHASERTEITGAKVAGSRRFIREAQETASVSLDYYGYVPSLAYRLALVASGEIDAAIARPGAYDWDLAAADLLVHEAGGLLTEAGGDRPRYNGRDSRHAALVAAAPALGEGMVALLAGAGSVPPRPA